MNRSVQNATAAALRAIQVVNRVARAEVYSYDKTKSATATHLADGRTSAASRAPIRRAALASIPLGDEQSE